MAENRHKNIRSPRTARQQARDFEKAQKAREDKEAIGFDGRPRNPNPAMGIPFNPGRASGGKPEGAQRRAAPTPDEEAQLEAVESQEEEDEDFDEERESF